MPPESSRCSSTDTPDVIVGLPPGGRHELGALAFAVAARRRGVNVLYLGADVPLTGWLTAVESTSAVVAILGVVALLEQHPLPPTRIDA